MAEIYIKKTAAQTASEETKEEKALEIQKKAEIGTNGTTFSDHLKQHRETAKQFFYELDGWRTGQFE